MNREREKNKNGGIYMKKRGGGGEMDKKLNPSNDEFCNKESISVLSSSLGIVGVRYKLDKQSTQITREDSKRLALTTYGKLFHELE